MLVVDLEIKPECVDAFLTAAKGQAEQSIGNEPGCYRFDIIRNMDEPHRIIHYEIFEDVAAFEAHAKMDHTSRFSETIQSMIVKAEMRRGHIQTSISK